MHESEITAGMRSINTRVWVLLVALIIGFALAGCNFPGDTTTLATLAARITASSAASTALPPGTDPTLTTIKTREEPQIQDTSQPKDAPALALDYFSQTYPLSQTDYVIPLTIRHISDESATLFFELSAPASGLLVYRSMNPDSPVQGEVKIPASRSRHMLTIKELSPGVQYQAIVLIKNGEESYQQPGFNDREWGSLNFRTASGKFPLRVGVLGDTSFGDEATQKLVALMASKDLDFVLHTGDVVYETDASDLINSYATKYFEPFAPLLKQLPIYTVPGNHDYDTVLQWQGAPFYYYAFPPFPDSDSTYPETRRGNQYYAFNYQDIQFLMLDSQVFYGVQGRTEQDAWLVERLADPRFRITIPIFHISPYSSSVVHPDDGLPVRYAWNPLFETANVPISLSGHFHHYERSIANGLTYIVTGGGSSTLYAKGESLPESQIYARRTHFVLMKIFEDHIIVKAISMEGELIDQTTISLD